MLSTTSHAAADQRMRNLDMPSVKINPFPNNARNVILTNHRIQASKNFL